MTWVEFENIGLNQIHVLEKGTETLRYGFKLGTMSQIEGRWVFNGRSEWPAENLTSSQLHAIAVKLDELNAKSKTDAVYFIKTEPHKPNPNTFLP